MYTYENMYMYVYTCIGGAERADDAQETPAQSHASPSKLVYDGYTYLYEYRARAPTAQPRQLSSCDSPPTSYHHCRKQNCCTISRVIEGLVSN